MTYQDSQTRAAEAIRAHLTDILGDAVVFPDNAALLAWFQTEPPITLNLLHIAQVALDAGT